MYLDVPFVPTEENVVEAMLDLANVGPKDVLYDLGCGDGRILVAAARDRNACGVGIDIDPLRIADAMEYAGESGVEYLVDFIEEDIFSADFSEATVVSLYLLQSVNLQLRPRLLSQLKPGSRVVSHAFDMGEWKADETLKVDGVHIYKWIVPARVAGSWKWKKPDGRQYRVELQQEYQQVTGTAWIDGRKATLRRATLWGAQLELVLQADDATAPAKFLLTFANDELRSVSARAG